MLSNIIFWKQFGMNNTNKAFLTETTDENCFLWHVNINPYILPLSGPVVSLGILWWQQPLLSYFFFLEK